MTHPQAPQPWIPPDGTAAVPLAVHITAAFTGTSFTATTDPTDPAGVLAVSIDEDAAGGEGQQFLLVVTPAAATTVRVLRDGQEVARSTVSGSGTAMQVPRPTAGLVVEALDASGGTIANGRVAQQGAQRATETDTWNQE
ncbi:hypothetical protein ACLQ3H_32045 [Micromonospora saelicesensis]